MVARNYVHIVSLQNTKFGLVTSTKGVFGANRHAIAYYTNASCGLSPTWASFQVFQPNRRHRIRQGTISVGRWIYVSGKCDFRPKAPFVSKTYGMGVVTMDH